MTISPDDWMQLSEAAKAASTRAYCPYSKFPVGAALLGDDGHIYTGCNIENASYGLTVCAERNAVFNGVGRGVSKVLAIVVYTPTERPSTPCGACRQVLAEFGPDTRIRCICNGPEQIEHTLAEFFPFGFDSENLKK